MTAQQQQDLLAIVRAYGNACASTARTPPNSPARQAAARIENDRWSELEPALRAVVAERDELRALRCGCRRADERRCMMGCVHIIEQAPYKPGDQAPDGYLAWHEWAEVQHKAGLRQVECSECGLWRYPQQLSALVNRWEGKTSRGRVVKQAGAVCLPCAAKRGA